MPGIEFLGEEERDEVQEVLRCGMLFRYGIGGESKARSFELELARRLNIPFCYLCSSGTSALGLTLAAAGIGIGDEVIVPPFTFIATVEAVLLAGAVPVFADIDDTLGLDPQAVEAAITPHTRGVIAVHMCGSMARIDALVALCRRRGLYLIEDTAQALGATYRGQPLGTFGDMGCFSFDSVKTITCGEGGAVATARPELYHRVEQFADHGHDHLGANRGLDSHPLLGTNYRISELNAAIGLAQLRKLDRILEVQQRHKQILREALSRHTEVSLRKVPDPAGDSATFLTFFLPDATRAQQVALKFAERGIEGCTYWYGNNWHYLRNWCHLAELRTCAPSPLHLLNNLPDYSAAGLEQSNRIMSRAVSLPIKLSWTRQDLELRLAAFTECFRNEEISHVQESADGTQDPVRTGSLQPA